MSEAEFVTYECQVRTVIRRTVKVRTNREPVSAALDKVDDLNTRVPRAGLTYMEDEVTAVRALPDE